MPIKSMTVLYDADCPFCRRCRDWLESQPQRIPLRLVAIQAESAGQYTTRLSRPPLQQLTVITDDNSVYYADKALIMCLFATVHYHEWAIRLSSPLFLPLVRNSYEYLSRNRYRISRLFSLDDQHIVDQLRLHTPTDACAIPQGHPAAMQNHQRPGSGSDCPSG